MFIQWAGQNTVNKWSKSNRSEGKHDGFFPCKHDGDMRGKFDRFLTVLSENVHTIGQSKKRQKMVKR